MTYVIAEAGTGHNGSLLRAMELAVPAAILGVDAVKFQIFVPDEPLFCPIEGDEKRIPRWNKSALTFEDWYKVKACCDLRKIDFLASVFQPTGIEWLKQLEPKYYKVASRAAKTYPYDQVPGPFLISTGMGPPPLGGVHDLECLMQCVSKYPTPLSEAAWIGHQSFEGEDRDRVLWGLSDHSGTPWPAIDAIARGAEFIEVHFGDKEGPDGPVNLSTDELKLICEFRDAVTEMRKD